MKKPRPALSTADWSRLNTLLDQGLALDHAGREAWLRTLTIESEALQTLLQELLNQPVRRDGSEDRIAAAVAQVAAGALSAMHRDQAGDRVGPWQLERLLAEGGMGAVWIAQRADGVMQRTAALKLPRAEWIEPGISERIARERSILARLQHPNIAVLYDAGLTAQGRPYLALEYVDGASIDRYCAARDMAAILRLFVQVVRAVAYAHARLVIHRDLKPANVLVTPDGTPKLLDFGISKIIEGDAAAVDETALTRAAGRHLTLAYAAPEQLLGQPITVAVDVYALGVMLYEILAGRRPYTATDPRALEAEIVSGDVGRPSSAAADAVRRKRLRGDLDAIILTALQREPGERYQSAAELADDLDRHLDGQPVTARPDSRLYRLGKFVMRNRLPVAASIAVVLALSIGLGAALWQADRATSMNTFMLSLIRQADPNLTQRTREADLPMLASIESRIDHDFKGSPEQLLQLRLTVGEAYRNRGEMMAARRVFQRAAEDAASHVAADDLMLLTARVRASDYNLIVSTAASEQLDRAIEVLRGKSLKNTAAADLLVDALLIRQELQLGYGVPAYLPAERRLDTANEAKAVAIRAFGEGSRQHLRTVSQALFPTVYTEGMASARKSVESALRQAQLRNDGTATSAEYLIADAHRATLACEDRDQQAETLAALRKALDDVRAAHGPTSVLLEQLLPLLAQCLRAAADPAALAAEMEAYAIATAREQPPSTNIMRRSLRAFDAALSARNLAEAERFYQSAIANVEAITEPVLRDRLTIQARMIRICLLAGQGKAQAAEQAAAPLIAESDAVYAKVGRLTPRQGELWTCLADALRQQGRYEEAMRTLQTFGERCRTTQLSALNNTWTCEGNALIGMTLAALDAGRIDAARTAMERRRAMSADLGNHPTYALAYGRVLLETHRAAEAIEPLRRNYETWRALQPDSPFTAEALYWFGRASEAVGDQRGRAMVAQAKAVLVNSPVQTHRRLAANEKST